MMNSRKDDNSAMTTNENKNLGNQNKKIKIHMHPNGGDNDIRKIYCEHGGGFLPLLPITKMQIINLYILEKHESLKNKRYCHSISNSELIAP